jgi:hypothetical protein
MFYVHASITYIFVYVPAAARTAAASGQGPDRSLLLCMIGLNIMFFF